MNNKNGSAYRPGSSLRADNVAAEPLLSRHLTGSDVTTADNLATPTEEVPLPKSSLAAKNTPSHHDGDGACADRTVKPGNTSYHSSRARHKSVTIVEAENKNDNWRERFGDGSSSRTSALSGRPKPPATFDSPPDGGWGWVVVLSSFSISMLVDGVCFSFGIFFDEFRREFGSSKAATSWIGSVLNGTYLLIGPIVSALVNVYGCRRVAMSGAVLATFAFFISTYSTTLGMLIFTYGFLGGFGFGLMYLPAIVMVGYYFERRRALATGIACCGSGMGAFIFAPFSEYLIDEYGWRGSTWIISGLVLNGVVFALFYRPLPQTRPTLSDDADATVSAASVLMVSEMVGGESPVDSLTAVPEILVEDVDSKKTFMPDKAINGPGDNNLNQLKAQALELLQKGQKLTPSHRSRSVMLDEVSQHNDLTRLALSQDFGMALRKRHDNGGAADNTARGNLLFGSAHDMRASNRSIHEKALFYSGSLMHLPEYQELSAKDHASLAQQDKSDNHSAYDDFSIATTSPSAKSFSVAFSSVFDLSLLKSPTFLIYGASCFLCMLGFFVPFVYMPAHAIDLGLGSRNAAFLISIIGITNTIGRVGVGFVSDQPWADCLLINNVALMIGGTATVFVPFLPTYILLAIYSAVFGTAVAVFVSLRSIIMVELMGLERLTTAFGLVIMCQGMSAFLGAPIAGILSDHYGNYDAAFCLAGASLALSGVICLPLRRVARWESERARKKTADLVAMDAVTAAASAAVQTEQPETLGQSVSVSVSQGARPSSLKKGNGSSAVKAKTSRATKNGIPVGSAVDSVGSNVDGRKSLR